MKRYGPPGSRWNSKKYLAMHNRNKAEGLRRYWANKKAPQKLNIKQVIIIWSVLIIIWSLFLFIAL